MQRHSRNAWPARSGVAWLELLLGLAAVALLFQMFPPLVQKLAWTVDLRNWSQLTFFLVNFAVVLVLVSVRFGPELTKDWGKHRQQIAKEHAQAEKVKQVKEHREAIERINQSRKRRMY